LDSLSLPLRKYFGWDHFKDGQESVIEAILDGQDALAVLPTGGGKSLCYQLPALIKQGLVVVISPLVALMEDQVRKLQNRSIPAICIHSGLDLKKRLEAKKMMLEDDLRLLYLAPERLQSPFIQNFIKQKAITGKIVALAVDEAHCISAWGHNFRPLYRKIGEIRKICLDVPVVALSATAAPRVRADIIKYLNLKWPILKVCSARRSNLNYQIRKRSKNTLHEVLEALRNTRGASLIYSQTRKSVEKWSELLRANGIPAIPYHAGLDAQLREKALNSFLKESQPVLVATVAFGMGVDRSDVGLVLHLNLPSSPESYLQESGRAGRDGLSADCLILFSSRDRTRLRWVMESSERSKIQTRNFVENLGIENNSQEQLRRMEAIAEGALCIEQSLLFSIGEFSKPCGRCDRCLNSSSKQNWSSEASKLLENVDQKKGAETFALVQKLVQQFGNNQEFWSWLARRLVQEELLEESDNGTQMLFIKDTGLIFLSKPWPLCYSF